MKNTLVILSLLISLCCTTSAKAQKAYEIITYKATVYGRPATLQLADGYLLASKVIIRSKFGDQVYTPSADDAQGDLRFDVVKATGRYKDSKGSWLTLKKLDGPDYPSQLKAVYWDGKMQKVIVFKRR